MPLAPIAGGSGRSTPPQLSPPFEEKYPRMGRRKISLEPAARFSGAAGLSVINVSLCGPHSFDTSTFAPTANDGPAVPLLSAPVCRRARYLPHHVGLSGEFVWAETSAAVRHIANVKRFIKSSSRSGNTTPNGILTQGRDTCSFGSCCTGPMPRSRESERQFPRGHFAD